ncbi:MAG TPA: hypothetical protein VN428_14405 [Bryobacteraceae bacterium]|nr:hypothetical protein [Bryobacteraceae bacterium]
MKTRVTLLFFALSICAFAQIHAPRIGCFVDPQQRLRTVYGVAGSFVVGEPEREHVLAALCTATLTIVKTAASLEVNGTVYAAPEGTALIRRDGYVYYSAKDEWVLVTARSIEAVGPPKPLEAEAALDGTFVVIGGKRIALPGLAASMQEIGSGWYRVVLEDGAHVVASITRGCVYHLPEVAE